MNKSDLADYAREEYLEFGNNRTKNIAPSNSFLLTWSELYSYMVDETIDKKSRARALGS